MQLVLFYKTANFSILCQNKSYFSNGISLLKTKFSGYKHSPRSPETPWNYIKQVTSHPTVNFS